VRFRPHGYAGSVIRRPTVPLLVALACALGVLVTGLLALEVPFVHARDAAALHGFMGLDRPGVHGLLDRIVMAMDPASYALLGLVIVAAALVAGRPARAATVVVLLVGTGATTQFLKQVVASERFDAFLGYQQVGPHAFPSGHSTAAMTLALCAVLVAPPALRALVAALAGLGAAAVGYGLVILSFHYPSDVLGGYLVAGAWTAAAVAALRAIEARRAGEQLRAGPAPRVLLGLAAAPAVALGAVALAALALRGDAVTVYAFQRPTLVACALAIAALAGVLAAGFAREA
jgi:membrane-associated phospholipid phosphatase